MSIFEKIFGTAVQTPAPVQQPQAAPTPGNIPANAATALASTATPGTAPNGTVPGTTDITGGKAASGLDQFADLFNTDPAKAGEQGQPLFNVSHEKVLESARKQDFMAAITPEKLQLMAAGGPDAIKAMLETMQEMVQNGYAQSTFTATKLIEGGLEKGNYARTSDVDNRIRSSSVDNTLRDANPLFSNPATQPILENLKASLLVKFPQATPTEIAAMANSYIVEFAKEARAPQEAAAAAARNKQGPQAVDWSTFA